MAEVSYTELQHRVAEKLQIVADAEPLSADYAAKIIEQLESVQEQLDVLGIATFVVSSGIDAAYADPFADLTAAQCVDLFQIPEPRRSIIASERLGMPGRSAAERRMRSLFITTKQVTKPDVTVV